VGAHTKTSLIFTHLAVKGAIYESHYMFRTIKAERFWRN